MTNLKIGIVSDLHVEFWEERHFTVVGEKVQAALQDADLILLAGDINNGAKSVRTAQRLFPDKPVCLVAGNHEFYGLQQPYTLKLLRGAAEGTNVSFLQQETAVFTLKDRAVRVLGATLWTDFDLYGTPDISMFYGQRMLNDFRLIRSDAEGRKLTPALTVQWHQDDLKWLLAELEQPFDGTTIVMTHHAPVDFAISPQFTNDGLSPCFASRLGNHFVRDDVDLVVWGHTHYDVDRVIETTRFISSQTGYVKGQKVETGGYGTVIDL